jgi:hypothetical protein
MLDGNYMVQLRGLSTDIRDRSLSRCLKAPGLEPRTLGSIGRSPTITATPPSLTLVVSQAVLVEFLLVMQ